MPMIEAKVTSSLPAEKKRNVLKAEFGKSHQLDEQAGKLPHD